jgi:YVTN family beta-propeller protein
VWLALLLLVAIAGAVLIARQADDAGVAAADATRTSDTSTTIERARPSDPSTTTSAVAATTTSLPLVAGMRSTVGTALTFTRRIGGNISPKSVVASGHGVTFAQNMIYSHTVTAYGTDGTLVATIADAVDLAAFGITRYPPGVKRGGPVEVAFTPDGTKAYVSNYEMYGDGFNNPGDDVCSPAEGHDNSFVYRIDVATFSIDQVIEVGPVPKYVAVSPDGRWVLVSNWCGYDLSVIDAAAGAQVQRIPMGAYPRGIVVSPDSSRAYVAVMGGNTIKTLDLATFGTRTLAVLENPRHVVLSNDGGVLYVTLNMAGSVAAVDAATGRVLGVVHTGDTARSMAISADGESLYVVNYDSSTMSKLATADLSIVHEVATDPNPIGVTYDPLTGVVWVACYGGSIQLFQDG